MLKTNSKAAKRNIINYIREATAAGLENYENPKNYDTANDAELTAYIWDIFQSEKYYTLETIKRRNMLMYKVFDMLMYKVFEDWAQGLPSCGLADFWAYNPDPREVLGDILEETAAERNRYTMEEAAAQLTYLLYKVITDTKIVR